MADDPLQSSQTEVSGQGESEYWDYGEDEGSEYEYYEEGEDELSEHELDSYMPRRVQRKDDGGTSVTDIPFDDVAVPDRIEPRGRQRGAGNTRVAIKAPLQTDQSSPGDPVSIPVATGKAGPGSGANAATAPA